MSGRKGTLTSGRLDCQVRAGRQMEQPVGMTFLPQSSRLLAWRHVCLVPSLLEPVDCRRSC